MDATLVNTVVTVISIVVSLACACYSAYQARAAKNYKEGVQRKLNLFELTKYLERFHREMNDFIHASKGVDWNRGRNVEKLQGKLSTLIQDSNLILPMIRESGIEDNIRQEILALKNLLYGEFALLLADKKTILLHLDSIDATLSKYVNEQMDVSK